MFTLHHPIVWCIQMFIKHRAICTDFYLVDHEKRGATKCMTALSIHFPYTTVVLLLSTLSDIIIDWRIIQTVLILLKPDSGACHKFLPVKNEKQNEISNIFCNFEKLLSAIVLKYLSYHIIKVKVYHLGRFTRYVFIYCLQ